MEIQVIYFFPDAPEGGEDVYETYTSFDFLKDVKKSECIFSLDCSNNNLTELPEEILNAKNLQYLYCGFQSLKCIPSWIIQLEKLEKISLTETLIEFIPNEMSNMKNLKTLFLKNTRIIQLPEFLKNGKYEVIL
jgi:Leucine-rich repeat (LRR) protein